MRRSERQSKRVHRAAKSDAARAWKRCVAPRRAQKQRTRLLRCGRCPVVGLLLRKGVLRRMRFKKPLLCATTVAHAAARSTVCLLPAQHLVILRLRGQCIARRARKVQRGHTPRAPLACTRLPLSRQPLFVRHHRRRVWPEEAAAGRLRRVACAAPVVARRWRLWLRWCCPRRRRGRGRLLAQPEVVCGRRRASTTRQVFRAERAAEERHGSNDRRGARGCHHHDVGPPLLLSGSRLLPAMAALRACGLLRRVSRVNTDGTVTCGRRRKVESASCVQLHSCVTRGAPLFLLPTPAA